MNSHGSQGRHERGLDLAAVAIDFELTRAETAELETHLSTCPTCTRRASALRADASALARPLVLLPSRGVDDAIYAEIARRPVRPQRLVLIAAAALLVAALLGALAGGAYLLRSLETLPTTVVPSPTAPVAVVSPGPVASPDVAVGETWGTLAIPASDVGTGWIGNMVAVAATESGFVATGGPVCVPENEPTKCHASVWTAAAGEGWTRAPDQPGLAVGLGPSIGGPEKGIVDLAAGPAGLVAIGYPYDGAGPGIWRSPDGRTWERVQFDFGSSPADAFYHRITAVAASPQGYVIVGYVIEFVDPGPSARARAAAWISPDGVTWTRAVDTTNMDVGPCIDTGEDPICGRMLSVAPTASGFVAVGYARSGADPAELSQPAAWTSPDGLTWTRADAGLDFNGTLSGVTAGGPGLIAVGAVGTICQPDCGNASAGGVAATSLDGSTWSVERVTGAAALEDVVSSGSQVFALGVRNADADPRGDLQLWRSDDGVAWLRVPGLPSILDATAYRSLDVAAAKDRLVIVGWADVSGADVRRNFSYVSPPEGSPAAPTDAPSATPPFRLVFTDDTGSVTIDIDDQSGLLVDATKGANFVVDNPSEGLCRWEGTVVGPCGKEVRLVNVPSDESVLRVEWAAGGGCARTYSMTIDPTARKLRIEGPPGGSDSIGGSCDVTLRFSEPVPAEQVDAVLVARK